jgi:hypothetical protein
VTYSRSSPPAACRGKAKPGETGTKKGGAASSLTPAGRLHSGHQCPTVARTGQGIRKRSVRPGPAPAGLEIRFVRDNTPSLAIDALRSSPRWRGRGRAPRPGPAVYGARSVSGARQPRRRSLTRRSTSTGTCSRLRSAPLRRSPVRLSASRAARMRSAKALVTGRRRITTRAKGRGTCEGSLGLLPPGSDPVRNLAAPRALLV